MLVPCASVITLYDGSKIGGGEECVWNKQEVSKFIGKTFNLLHYFNQEEVAMENFDTHGRIQRKSMLSSSFSAAERATWTETFLERNYLEDEVDYFQIG